MNRGKGWFKCGRVGVAGWLVMATAVCRAVVAPDPGAAFFLKVPEGVTVVVAPGEASVPGVGIEPGEWLLVRHVEGGRREWMGRTLLVEPADGVSLEALFGPHGLIVRESLESGVVLVDTESPRRALEMASAWADSGVVRRAHPIRRHTVQVQSAFAARPNDPYFDRLGHLDGRPLSPLRIEPAVDLNVRSAWPVTLGAGVVVAFGDNGIESTHPDFKGRVRTELGFDFFQNRATGDHQSSDEYHGTATAGFVIANRGNRIGGVGGAPEAQGAAHVIFDSAGSLVDEVGLGKAFAYNLQSAAIQNHSWANADFEPLAMAAVESAGVSNAISQGRSGLGVVIVRSGGNARRRDFSQRLGVGDGNLDAFGRDPRVIAVGAVRGDGRVATYSAPGANLLVSAPGGDPEGGFPRLFSTDRAGRNGRNIFDAGELKDYCTGLSGLFGTSFSAPQVTAVVALMLAANPGLTYRDVQYLLVLCSRHLDLADPDLVVNGAGLSVSHNVGFGLPDAGDAVRLAVRWPRVPAVQTVTVKGSGSGTIPDDGLRLEVKGNRVPSSLASVPATGSLGVHPDRPTAELLLRDVGEAAAPLPAPGGEFGAVVLRGGAGFAEPAANARAAGAAFVVVANNQGRTDRMTSGSPDPFRYVPDVDFLPAPVVMIDQDSGQALRTYLAGNPGASGRLRVTALEIPFQVKTSLRCEHVGVRLQWRHTSMADLRVTLTSPSGTISVLLRPGMNAVAVPDAFEFWSVHHFGEAAAGTWTLRVADEWPGSTGRIDSAELTVRGVPIADTDLDGLDDGWEREHFRDLSRRPGEDPDGDGSSNFREALSGTNPTLDERPFVADLSADIADRLRLSWPGRTNGMYEILGAGDAAGPYSLLQLAPGTAGEMGIYLTPQLRVQHYRVRR